MTATNNIETIHNVHPWRRYFARLLDILLMSFVFGVSLVIFFPSVGNIVTDLAENKALDMVLSGFFAMLLNPFFISLFGSTPGKYLFGIQVRGENTRKLSLLTALKREFLVYMKGLAFCFPIANIFTLISSHSRLKKQGNTSWDEDLKCKVVYRQNNLKQKILNVIGIALYVLLIVVLVLPDDSKAVSTPSLTKNKTVTHPSKKNTPINIKDLKEAFTIYNANENGYIGRNEYIKLLTTCSKNGNLYCSVMLGDFYYGEGEYHLAYPLLIAPTEVRFKFIEIDLGYMLMNGYGVSPNVEQAIDHFKKAAQLGSSMGAYNLGVVFGNKYADLVKEDNNPDVKSNLIQAYAWYKIADNLGKDTATNTDGTKEDISIELNLLKTELVRLSAFSQAQELANKICSTIPKCK